MTGQHPLHLILDESAVVAFVSRSNLAVGEALTLVLDEKEPTEFGVHITTLASAAVARRRQHPFGKPDEDALTVETLTAHPAFRPLAVHPDDLDELVMLSRLMLSVDRAAALITAARHDCFVLTAEANLYDSAPDELRDRVIGF